MLNDSSRTFDLFKRTGVPLIDYLLKGENTPKRYNGITVFPPKDGATVEEDPYHVSESNGGLVPDQYDVPIALLSNLPSRSPVSTDSEL